MSNDETVSLWLRVQRTLIGWSHSKCCCSLSFLHRLRALCSSVNQPCVITKLSPFLSFVWLIWSDDRSRKQIEFLNCFIGIALTKLKMVISCRNIETALEFNHWARLDRWTILILSYSWVIKIKSLHRICNQIHLFKGSHVNSLSAYTLIVTLSFSALVIMLMM